MPDPTNADDDGVEARQQHRWETLRAALLAQGVYTYDELSALRTETVEGARAAIHGSPTRILVVTHEGAELLPRFQFTTDGQPRPELKDLIHELLQAGYSPWETWTWLTTPTGMLTGEIPAALAADPAQHHRVAAAVHRTAARHPGHTTPPPHTTTDHHDPTGHP